MNAKKGAKKSPTQELSPEDLQLERLVCARADTIVHLFESANMDTARLITFLKHRVELEEGYQGSLNNIMGYLEEREAKNPLYGSAVNTSIQRAITDYVVLSNQVKPTRQQYIQTLKSHIQNLVSLHQQHEKLARRQRKAMNHINYLYLTTRVEELAVAREAYLVKCEEMESQSPMAMSPGTPMTPMTTGILSPSRPQFFPPNRSGRSDDSVESKSAGDQDDLMSTWPAATPSSAAPQKRIHYFMKQLQHHAQDPAKQAARVAKLKLELTEADVKYRQVVRRLNTLSLKRQNVIDAAVHVLQEQLKEKAQLVKKTLDQLLTSEAHCCQHGSQVVHGMQHALALFKPELDQHVFDNLLANDKYPMPSPIYYINYHVGECKDLIFGMSLTEYAQTRGRSPPMIITKCIHAIEERGGLEREGIYRISGKQSNIEKIKQAFERDESLVEFGQNGLPDDVFCIASVLKIFLRELATPLFPFAPSDRAVYAQIPDKELRLMNLLTRLLKLPDPNYDALKFLIEHLARCERNVDKNKMTASNLSLMFSPSIFQDQSPMQLSPREKLKDCVVEDLLANAQSLFAHKNLHGASSITGIIDYGIENTRFEPDDLGVSFDDYDDDDDQEGYLLGEAVIGLPPVPNLTSSIMTDEPESMVHEHEHPSGTDWHLSSIHSGTSTPSMMTASTVHSHLSSSLVSPDTDLDPMQFQTMSLAAGPERRRSKFRTVSQDLGLTVNTNHDKSTLMGAAVPLENHKTPQLQEPVPSPAIQSAIVPSLDWAQQDPDQCNNQPIPPSKTLRRAATTGRPPKSIRRQLDSQHVPPLPPVPALPK
ncbi:RhoGAP-domain-containing protein [Hesseltinella vesiculosa]|uniref:RhoGAP-domain-containing protein n=1 Tax=Hesseltinella vesiculosa TaxID=101127 RepID=A0A1X2GTM2_9FUNG|nr:RhoGAP-domain-containing protein [Hesseltinella vesiculosa]